MNGTHRDGAQTMVRPRAQQPTPPVLHQRSSTRQFTTPTITHPPVPAGDYDNAGPDVYWPVNPTSTVQHPRSNPAP